VVSSAVYRYVASRDELLTLLVVDGYAELGHAVDAALAPVPREEFARRMLVIGRAVRDGAPAEPATCALLFGSPVPGYEAPAERTTESGTLIARGLVAWAALVGRVSFEAFGQYGADTFSDPKDLFEHRLGALVASVGLHAGATS
jgi:AcrR family transcriptional regulator